MKSMLVAVAALGCVLAALIGGCRRTGEVPKAPDGQALRPVSLPDMSRAAAPVQSQLRERYASLKLKVEHSGTPTAELAEAYGEMGKLLMATEYLDAAEPCLLNAQTLAPSDMRWPYYLGHLHRFRNDSERARIFFEQALQVQPDHVAALIWLGEMHLAQSRPETAEPPLTKALSIQPRAGAALYGLGRAALARRDYARAVKYLEAALAANPSASRIHYPLAMAYRGLGDRRQAEAHLRRRGEANLPPPDPLMEQLAGLLQTASAYEVRGSEALDKRDWAEAVKQLGKAIELSPDNPFSRLNLGTALFLTGDAQGAMRQFEEAVRLSPEFAKAHYSLGVLMEASGRDKEAIDRFSAAVRYEATYVEAHLSLADALRRSGRLEESLSHYAQVVKIDPGVSQARFGYAMALVRLRRYQEARERLTEAMKTYPDQPGFAHALARLLAAAPDDAVRDGRRAMAIMRDLLKDQRTLALTETMAMTLAELEEYEQAVEWQREAMAAAERAGRAEIVKRLAENLARYQRRQPCRTPWRDDDPVHAPRPQPEPSLLSNP